MLAIDLISEDIPALKTTDTGTLALQWMEDYKVSDLPVVKNNLFIGIINENDVLNFKDPDLAIGKQKLNLNPIAVISNEHIYEVLNKISSGRLSIMPIIDKDGIYLGVISLYILIQSISKLTAINDVGGILQLELNINDYSLSEIASIVESNGGKILSSYVHTHTDSTKMDVTIKINKSDLSGIIQTFERYNYSIAASFHKSEMEDLLKQRYQEFLHFLNM
tara:strand:- start:28 stop:690 length:663 start_codon:yes stop_codon:yes gene_type:complete